MKYYFFLDISIPDGFRRKNAILVLKLKIIYNIYNTYTKIVRDNI